MRSVYNQKALTITIDGVTMQDYFEGASVIITWDGGEVQKTQGTDGAGINLATNQGNTIQYTLRETSRSLSFVQGLRLSQENGGAGVTAIIRTGADILISMTDSYVSQFGQLSSGDKMQGGIQITLTSANTVTGNLIRDADGLTNMAIGAIGGALGV